MITTEAIRATKSSPATVADVRGEWGAPAVAWFRQPDFDGKECWEAVSADDSLDDFWRSIGPRWKPSGDLERTIGDTPQGILVYWNAEGERIETAR